MKIYKKSEFMEAAYNKKSRLWPVFFVFFVDNFGFALVFSLFGPLLLNPTFGMLSSSVDVPQRNLMIGLLFASFPLAQFLGAPIIGDFADHYGRKKAFYITLIGSALGYFISAFSIAIGSYILLIASRLLTGLCAGNLGICLAAIADLSPTERSRGRSYGFFAMTAGVSWVLSMIVGSYLSDPHFNHYFNPAIPFMICTMISLIALIAVVRCFEDARTVKAKSIDWKKFYGLKNVLTAFKIREIRFLYIVYLFWIISWGIVLQWYVPFSIEKFSVEPEELAWGMILFGISWSFGGSMINYVFLRSFHSRVAALLSLILITIFISISIFMDSFALFTVFFLLASVFGGVAMSNLLNMISMQTPYNMQGKVLGISQSMISLAWIIGPIVSGFIAKDSIYNIYPFTSALMIVCCVLLLIYNQILHKNRSIDLH